MSDIHSLEVRADAAIAKLKTPPISDTSDAITPLKAQVADLEAALDAERGALDALRAQHADVTQKLDTAERAAQDTAPQTTDPAQTAADPMITTATLKALVKDRTRDIKELDEILGLLEPLVEG